METHAHDLHKAPGHGWKHYLFEFLMLFLAVFCGFLAENFREHEVEEERGNQYIHSFYEDLLVDSSHFNKLINLFQIKLSVLQNMSPCYDSLLSDNPSKNCLSTIVQNSLFFPDMINTDGTLIQLKNAGGLRLLKKADADSILLYDNLLRIYKSEETSGVQEMQTALRQTITMLGNYESWKDTTNSTAASPTVGCNAKSASR